jgi:hypothetical protein
MRNTVPARFIPYDAKDPDMIKTPIEQLSPPEGAPNGLIVLIDDCGFGAPIGPVYLLHGRADGGLSSTYVSLGAYF